eukprot:362252_1
MDAVIKQNSDSGNTNNYSTQIVGNIDQNDSEEVKCICHQTITDQTDNDNINEQIDDIQNLKLLRNETKDVQQNQETIPNNIPQHDIRNKYIQSLQNIDLSDKLKNNNNTYSPKLTTIDHDVVTLENHDIPLAPSRLTMIKSEENTFQSSCVGDNKRNTVYQKFISYYLNGTCTRKSPNKIYLICYNLLMPFFVIATASCFGYLFKMPFIFPSLGPTAFLHSAIPNKPPSSPKNTLFGHLIGILSGSLSLQITNLYYNDVIFIEGVIFERIWCAALSVGITCFLMILCHVEHPPAGATTLIVSLGILKTPFQLMIMMIAVLLLTVESFIINRIFRKDAIYPIWNALQNKKQSDEERNSLRGYTLIGFSSMRLADFNMPRKKLDVMRYSLGFNNFIEYFKICNDIGTIDEMRFLLQFAQQNKKTIEQLDDYHEIIPFAARVFIQGLVDEESS